MSEARETKRVEFKTRPDLVLHVRALNSLEAIQLHSALSKLEQSHELVAEQLVALVCNQDGTPKFADRAAAIEFMKSERPGVVTKLVKSGTAFNELNDEAIEEELKN
jgi:hypothetical protein